MELKIKMRTLAAGPTGAMEPGKVYNVDEKEAKQLVDGLYAKYVDAPAVQKDDSPELPTSLEEFSELKADEQKALLKELGIEGDDSNEEKRIALFEAFLQEGE